MVNLLFSLCILRLWKKLVLPSSPYLPTFFEAETELFHYFLRRKRLMICY